MRFIKKNQKVVFIAGLVIIFLGIFLYWQRQITLSNATVTKLKDEPRKNESVSSDFYREQLTQKESAVYGLMEERLKGMMGGEVIFPDALNGSEYLRVTTALEDEGYNYFYGFYDIPMTVDDVYVKHKNADLTTIRERTISKAILFLCGMKGSELGEQRYLTVRQAKPNFMYRARVMFIRFGFFYFYEIFVVDL